MLRGLLGRLRARFESEEEDGDGRFVPSPLDASVRYAHGGSETEIDREMGRIEEEARRLDDR